MKATDAYGAPGSHGQVSITNYLGEGIDQRLSFRKEVQFHKDRTKIRFNVMRPMTTTRANATYRVLRLSYVQAILSLIDYLAVTLVSVSDINKRALETIPKQYNKKLS